MQAETKRKPVPKLIKLRLERGWSQTKAAAEMGFSQGYLAFLENGFRPINGNVVIRIAEVYNLKLDVARKLFLPKNVLSARKTKAAPKAAATRRIA
jgi:transcriptional regulator with XRE-family HTH domain